MLKLENYKGNNEHEIAVYRALSCLTNNQEKWMKDFKGYKDKICSALEYKYDKNAKEYWKWKHNYNTKLKKVVDFEKDELMEYSTLMDFVNNGYTSIRYNGFKIATINRKKDVNSIVKVNSSEETIKNRFNVNEAEKLINGLNNKKITFESKIELIKNICHEKNLKNKNSMRAERALEEMCIYNFTKKNKDNNLVAIQPVVLPIWNLPYQFPTPSGASHYHDKSYVYYVKNNRAGIDILARIGEGGNNRLAIIELKNKPSSEETKKKNYKKETLKDALNQALIYSTFIASLIDFDREESNTSSEDKAFWYHWFGKNDDTYKNPIRIYAVAAYPEKCIGSDYEKDFAGKTITLKNGDFKVIIELHYMLIDDDAKVIETSINKR